MAPACLIRPLSAPVGHRTRFRALLDESLKLQAWLDIIAILAEAQAEGGNIPQDCAQLIREHADVSLLDIDEGGAPRPVPRGHSTLGLIRLLQQVLPERAREWVYFGRDRSGHHRHLVRDGHAQYQ